MTDRKKTSPEKNKKAYAVPPFHMELEKRGKGAVILVTGIVSVDTLTKEEALLVTHSGRLLVVGEGLLIVTFEDRTVELSGRIEEVKLLYGRN